jgi:hypothetical protein
MAGRHARGRRHVLDEPSGNAIAPGPPGRRAREHARPLFGDASWPGQAGERTADAVDGVHGGLLMSWDRS